MEMMNRAVEDASDFMEIKRRLLEGTQSHFQQLLKQERQPAVTVPLTNLQKQPGENRQQYRERMRRERRAAAK